MATMNTVIEYVDRMRPNVFTDEDKYRWLATLEGMLAREVRGEEVPQLDLPRDGDEELAVGAPYEELYPLYAMAMVDFYNREYDQYNNTMAMFAQRLEQYRAWYIQEHPVCKAANWRNVH